MKAQDTLIIWSQLRNGSFRFQGSRSYSLETFTQELDRIDPECYRTKQMVSSPEGDAYEVVIFPTNKKAEGVAV